MTAKVSVLICFLALGACGSSTASTAPPVPTAKAPQSEPTVPAPTTSATATVIAGLANCATPSLGILGAVAATATNPDGSAKDPAVSFPTATTGKLMVVIAVQGLAAGTKLSFTRYLDGKFVDTKSAAIARATPYFYFDFTAQPGRQITTGTYQVRLYVNEARACNIEYTVV